MNSLIQRLARHFSSKSNRTALPKHRPLRFETLEGREMFAGLTPETYIDTGAPAAMVASELFWDANGNGRVDTRGSMQLAATSGQAPQTGQSFAIADDYFATNNVLSIPVMEALEAARMNRLTVEQRTLLFVNNDVINRARLNGDITNAHYQAAQADFKRFNESIASRAARDVGGKFNVQVAKNETFSPGTDSDYIIEIKSHDPVGDVRSMQRLYNTYVNQALEQRLGKEAARALYREDWHVQLDVDFMVDPRYVTDEQFKQIAELNNAAYSRRLAAEYERISRLPAPAVVTPAHIRDYTLEMNDLMKVKQEHQAKLHADPRLLTDPTFNAEYQRLAALEQKYIERLEATNMRLRKQEGLTHVSSPYSERYYDFTVDAKGRAVVKFRTPDSLAARGAFRGPENRRITATAHSLAPLSTQRAVLNLADSMVEAELKKFRDGRPMAQVGRDLAHLTSSLSLADKGRLIESMKLRFGPVVATELVKGFRAEYAANITPDNPLDRALRNAIGVSDEVRDMSKMRRSVNQFAAKTLKIVDKLDALGNVLMIKDALTAYSTFVSSIAEAYDPNLTSEEREALLMQAQESALSLVQTGGMGVLFAKFPTLAAGYAGWRLGYDGTRFLLENTELGQWIDFKADQYAERMLQSYDAAYDALTELLGGTSQAMEREDQLFLLESRLIKLLKEGKVTIKEGMTALDVLSTIRKGDLAGLDELIQVKGAIPVEEARPAAPREAHRLERLGWQQLGGTLNNGENIYTNRFKIRLNPGDKLDVKLEISGPSFVSANFDIFPDSQVTVGEDKITIVESKDTWIIWVQDDSSHRLLEQNGLHDPPPYSYRLTVTVTNVVDLPSATLPPVTAGEWEEEIFRLNGMTASQAGQEIWKYDWQRRIESLNQMTAPRAAEVLWTRSWSELTAALNQMSAARAAEIIASYSPANQLGALNRMTPKRASEVVFGMDTWTDRIAAFNRMSTKRVSDVIWNYSWTDLTATLDRMTSKRASLVIWNYDWTRLTATLDHMTARRASQVIWNYDWTNFTATLDHMTAKRVSEVVWNYDWTKLTATFDKLSAKRVSEVIWNYNWTNLTATLDHMTAQRAAEVIAQYSAADKTAVLNHLTPTRRSEIAMYL